MKRGQAAGAAILLVIIAGLLILFILNLSPNDRAELLGEDSSSNTRTNRSSRHFNDSEIVTRVLLEENPGRVDFLSEREIEHPLPVVNVYTKQEAEALAQKNLAYVKKNIFDEEKSQFTFSISDLQNTDNIVLSFSVSQASGRLLIDLNGQVIYNGEVPTTSIKPISLPRNVLQGDNILTFSASSPGLAFWHTNEIQLENIKVIADVTNTDAQTSRHVFLVSTTEKRNLEDIMLKFQPTCKFQDVGPLDISINGNEVYSGVPDCNLAMVPISFDPAIVREGENTVVFFTERGNYILTHINIESKLEDLEFPTYYFDVSNEDFELIEDGDRRARLQLDFVDVVTTKFGDVVVNGHLNHFDTREASYRIDITDDIENGRNSVKIKPRKTVEIRELQVELVK
jgi:hypothetical protein